MVGALYVWWVLAGVVPNLHPIQMLVVKVTEVRRAASPADLNDVDRLRERLQNHLETQLQTSGPIRYTPDKRRVVALVGPTGVGKTTTIAKLAANRQVRSVANDLMLDLQTSV